MNATGSTAPLLRWQPTTTPPPLTAASVHVWRIFPDVASTLAQDDAAAVLSNKERERAARFYQINYQRRYIYTHAQCRFILARYLNQPPERLAFHYTAHGKPQLTAPAMPIEFNLTTSGDLALLALSLAEPIGIDCEYLRPRRDLFAIAQRMFDAAAVQQLTALQVANNSELVREFYRHWTALEARVKRDGRGLSGHRKADDLAIDIAHAQPDTNTLCAIARRDLPAASEWLTFIWAE
ncbi:4'-phosphopantetheinyl transferase superfamily protein [Rhodoferax sp. 4810]|nr:4'-phosphopantetheinyl transferase superfamily protein [Rhodoferax jenense]